MKDYHARVTIVLIATRPDKLLTPRVRYWAPTLVAAKILRRKIARKYAISVQDITLSRVQIRRTQYELPDFLNQLEKDHGNQ